MSKLSKERLSQYFFLILLFLVLWLSYSILEIFITSILLSVILTYYFYPAYTALLKFIKNKSVCSLIMILLILLLIVPPMLYILLKLTNEAILAIQNVKTVYGPFLHKLLYPYLNAPLPFTDLVAQIGTQLVTFTKSNAQSIVSSVSNAILQLFIFFFVMYYCFKEGPAFFSHVQDVLPLRKQQKSIMIQELKRMIHAVIHGQFTTALLQGIIGGIALWLLGVPSPIFLGFVMFIFSFLPVVGSALIWIPSSIWLALEDHTYRAIALAVFGLVVLSNIDNLIRPKLIHNNTNLHPVLVFLGVLGGLNVFGFSGILLGPIVLLMLTVLVRFYREEHAT
ncbi:MAG TPA: AI-2E family transporter [Candidatus Nanoarchaeia archaeon]|nr:AI-2E family transporter [Candidatus Nanoarchaeia archaeon]